jgi:hypothetical protein
VPCFEIWLLLHFVYTTKAFGSTGASGSICASVIKELKKKGRIPDYEKGAKDIFPQLMAKLSDALVHAARLEQHWKEAGCDNPSTQMHILVNYLRKLKK